ncbi:hypothetical protein [Mesorhizobium sp. 10J20-29]
MKKTDPGDVSRAVDALVSAYGIGKALEKARLAETDSVVPDFAKAVREELEKVFAESLRRRD